MIDLTDIALDDLMKEIVRRDDNCNVFIRQCMDLVGQHIPDDAEWVLDLNELIARLRFLKANAEAMRQGIRNLQLKCCGSSQELCAGCRALQEIVNGQ